MKDVEKSPNNGQASWSFSLLAIFLSLLAYDESYQAELVLNIAFSN